MINKKMIILLSTYNGEKYIEEQLNSLFNQNTNVQIDILIRDDGSKDKTIPIINKIAKTHSNLTLIEGKNVGVNCSFFELLNQAGEYDYYAFCDQDDIWLDDKISVAVSMIMEKEQYYDGPVLYGGCSWLVDTDLNKFGVTVQQEREITPYNTIIHNFLPGHAQVFNRQLYLLLKNVQNIENIYVYDAWVTNVAAIKGFIIFDNEPHTLYRQHANNAVGFSGKTGFISWFIQRIKRIRNDESISFSKQMKLFYDTYENEFDEDFKLELFKFFDMQKNIISRFAYITKTKFYRQSKVQTILYQLLYLFGGYNLDK